MSQDLEFLINTAWERKQSLKNIEEKANSRLCVAHQGGMWRCDREFISFLSAFSDSKELVVADIYHIPRKINPKELLHVVKSNYQHVMNEWMIEYQSFVKSKKPSDLVDNE